jgi:protein CpxP
MKFLVQSLFAAALMLTAASCAEAQDAPATTGQERRGEDGRGPGADPAKMAERQTERMTEVLKLSADQRTKVQAINEKYAAQMKQLHDAKTAERGAMREKMQSLRQQQNTELNTVLNAGQQATWQKESAERRGHGRFDGPRGEGRGHGRDLDPAAHAGRQTARMTEVLKLTSDQCAKVEAINRKYAEQHAALRQANGSDTDREARRAKKETLRNQHQTELKNVLTAEQWATWEKEKPQGRGKKGKRTPE